MLLGVATAVSWGSADFFARFASRRVGAWRALFGTQAWGALFVTILLLFLRDWGHLFDGSGWKPWAWGILAGVVTTFAMLALYRAFAVGKMAVVAPISASYPALTLILSLFSGETFSVHRAAGIGSALLGVVLVAAGEKVETSSARGSERVRQAATPAFTGVGWACAAAICFGILFWLFGARIIPRTGALGTLWLIRVTGAAITFSALLAKRSPLRAPDRQTGAQLYSMGFFDTAAFAFSNLGMRVEQTAVVTVLGSLYGAVTVALAAIFLRERIALLQWAGVAAIFSGIVLMSL
jgi:drug/metabolite transporter (DMT)-like permease